MLAFAVFLVGTMALATPYDKPHYPTIKLTTGTCSIEPGAISWDYTVTISDDNASDKHCGRALLDNMRGQALDVMYWACDRKPDGSASTTFTTPIDTAAQVETAFSESYNGTIIC